MRTATYLRYSSENQRDASIEDQLRDNTELATRCGLPVPEVYQDKGISGERRDRPGYVRLLRDAQAGRYEVLLLWDLKRLSRAEDLPQVLAKFRFWRIRIITCDGFDTAEESSEIRGWLDSLIGNRYLKDLAKNTHRGLKGRALSGASAGGLPYGYYKTSVGERAIDEAQAAVVRRIFSEFASGLSPRAIAAALNRDAIPSPRGGTWAMTAIRADVRRGIGILGNPIYIGQQVWNRSHWVKHPETGRRVRQERPRAEWVVTEHAELAIVDRALWDAVQARIGGRKHASPTGKGRPPRHVLSGILRCGECGGPMVVVDRYRYGCARAKDRGTCTSRLRFARLDAEHALLAGIRAELLTDEGFRAFQRAATEALRRAAPDLEAVKRRRARAQREHDNVMAALRAGIITAGTKAELERLEQDLAAADRELRAGEQLQPARILPRAREVWERMATRLSDLRDKPAAREALRTLLGDRIPVHTDENGDPVAEIAASSVQICVVAGAGFEPATFGL